MERSACFFSRERKKKLPKQVRAAGTLFITVLFALFLLTESLIFGSFLKAAPDGLDYLLVLGTQILEDGRPGRDLKYRLDTAYDYLSENEETLVIVSGGQGSNEPISEAQGMKEYLLERGSLS